MLTLISKLLPIAKKPGSVFKRTRPGLPTRHQFELHEIQLGGGCVCGYPNIRIGDVGYGRKKARNHFGLRADGVIVRRVSNYLFN